MPITEEATLTVPDAPLKPRVSRETRGVANIMMDSWVSGKGLTTVDEEDMLVWIIQHHCQYNLFPMEQAVNSRITELKSRYP